MMIAGTKKIRITIASNKIANQRANPKTLRIRLLEIIKVPNALDIMSPHVMIIGPV